MVARTEALPITRQCELLDLPRSTFYHVPEPASDVELGLMKLIDKCHLKHPYYGSRRVRDWLEDRGHRVNRKRVQRLMRTMGLVEGAGLSVESRPVGAVRDAQQAEEVLLRCRSVEQFIHELGGRFEVEQDEHGALHFRAELTSAKKLS